jgi:hypothetical protein
MCEAAVWPCPGAVRRRVGIHGRPATSLGWRAREVAACRGEGALSSPQTESRRQGGGCDWDYHARADSIKRSEGTRGVGGVSFTVHPGHRTPGLTRRLAGAPPRPGHLLHRCNLPGEHFCFFVPVGSRRRPLPCVVRFVAFGQTNQAGGSVVPRRRSRQPASACSIANRWRRMTFCGDCAVNDQGFLAMAAS